MKRYLLTIIFCVKIVLATFSQERPKFFYGTYLVKDNLDWSIAGNVLGESPNIYSELIFNNVISFGQSLSFGYNPVSNLGVAITFKKQRTFAGSGTDTDYASDNRTDVFSDLKFISKKGEGQTIDFQVYYNLLTDQKVVIDLGLNYLLHHQTFYLNSDEVNKLNSKYKIYPEKYGIFIKMGIRIFEYTDSFVALRINNLNYYAEADWNLIEGLRHPISFTHKSNGYNLGILLKNKINISRRFSLVFEYEKSIDKYQEGLDVLYLRPRSEKYTRFNGGKLNSDLLGLGIVFLL